MKYNALYVTEEDGKFNQNICQLDTSDLPQNEVLIRVYYSSLNYKDALSATGNKGVTRKYPHTPGIDAVGVVEETSSSQFAVGEQVIVTSYDLGMNTPGGFGQYIKVPADWIVRLPEYLSMKEAMIIGTAGFTSGIAVSLLQEKVKPTDGQVIVTGATGGVGSVALNILSKLGYNTVAVSGKMEEQEFLRILGAKEIILRSDFLKLDKKPILSARYAGAIDTVGGEYLENILKTLNPQGMVATCGSVAGTNLNISVFPFILRGITLTGISAQNYPLELRPEMWEKLGKAWRPDYLLQNFNEITLNELPKAIELILQGKLKGRTIVNMVD